jgi:Excalibur calcium-binding domain
MRILTTAGALWIATVPINLSAHGGGLAADGCHSDKKNGGRHCHRGHGNPLPAPQMALGGSIYFPNCASARAAGVTPLRAGQKGYGRHLDRDGDGIGCE